jgi:hypothetical protein
MFFSIGCAGVAVRRASSEHDFLANLDQLVALSNQRPASATSERQQLVLIQCSIARLGCLHLDFADLMTA